MSASTCGFYGCDNPKLTVHNGTDICYGCLDTVTTCAKWKCENRVKPGHSLCVEHPPPVDHGLHADKTECPDCGHVGMGTIHDDLWYCQDIWSDGCGNLHDPYQLAGVEKKPAWEPP